MSKSTQTTALSLLASSAVATLSALSALNLFLISAHAQTFSVVTHNVAQGATLTADVEAHTSTSCPPAGDSACTEGILALEIQHIIAMTGNEPALVGLQELDVGTTRTGQVNEPQFLSDAFSLATGVPWTSATAVHGPTAGGNLVLAMFSNLELQFSKDTKISSPNHSQPRSMSTAEANFGNGNYLWFGVVHLTSIGTAEALDELERAAEELSYWSGITGGEPAILVGDFNLSWTDGCEGYANCYDAAEARLHGQGDWVDVTSNLNTTHLNLASNFYVRTERFDYIYVLDPNGELELIPQYIALGDPGGTAFSLPSHTEMPCYGAICWSDHMSVTARFRWRP